MVEQEYVALRIYVLTVCAHPQDLYMLQKIHQVFALVVVLLIVAFKVPVAEKAVNALAIAVVTGTATAMRSTTGCAVRVLYRCG